MLVKVLVIGGSIGAIASCGTPSVSDGFDGSVDAADAGDSTCADNPVAQRIDCDATFIPPSDASDEPLSEAELDGGNWVGPPPGFGGFPNPTRWVFPVGCNAEMGLEYTTDDASAFCSNGIDYYCEGQWDNGSDAAISPAEDADTSGQACEETIGRCEVGHREGRVVQL